MINKISHRLIRVKCDRLCDSSEEIKLPELPNGNIGSFSDHGFIRTQLQSYGWIVKRPDSNWGIDFYECPNCEAARIEKLAKPIWIKIQKCRGIEEEEYVIISEIIKIRKFDNSKTVARFFIHIHTNNKNETPIIEEYDNKKELDIRFNYIEDSIRKFHWRER